jgi:hypothetical protein
VLGRKDDSGYRWQYLKTLLDVGIKALDEEAAVGLTEAFLLDSIE